MKSRTLMLITAAGLFAWNATATYVHAQKGMGDPIGMARRAAQPEITTLSGVLLEVKTGPCESTKGKSVSGTHILLQTDDETVHEIHLGPQRDVASVAEKMITGQTLSVAGFQTEKTPENTLVAQSLTIGDETFRLRGDDLRPTWAGRPMSGQGRGNQPRGRQQRQGARRGNANNGGQGGGLGRGSGGPPMGQVSFADNRQPCGLGDCRGGNRQGRGQGRRAQQGPGQRSRGGRGPGSGRATADFACAGLPAIPADASANTPLTPAEREGLLLMREEEKLAHDAYVTLSEQWSLRPFVNISQAETRHMNAVKMLLERYDIEDPLRETTIGVFPSTRMQEMYDQLMEQGRASVEEAIRVGVRIEELDIADLRRLIDVSRNEDVKFVYRNLLRASEHHLSAFQRQLARFGDATVRSDMP